MKYFIVIISIISSTYSFSQKKLIQLLDGNFIQMEGQNEYPYQPSHKDVVYDTSSTFLNDTTGAHWNGEFVLFKDSIYFKKAELFKLVSTELVSIAEYNEFIAFSWDSIMRGKLYFNTDPNTHEFDNCFHNIKTIEYPISQKKVSKIYSGGINEAIYTDSTGFNFIDSIPPTVQNYDYNWKSKLKEEQYFPLISDCYLRSNQRIWKIKAIDKRKVYYKVPSKSAIGPYFGLRELNEIHCGYDELLWTDLSKSTFDIYYNLAQYFYQSEQFEEFPATGLNGAQIRGYFHFLQKRIQDKIDRQHLPYKIYIALPTIDELQTLQQKKKAPETHFFTEEYDFTEQWKITNQEYFEFIEWVEDSINREFVYSNPNAALSYEELAKLLDHPKEYYREEEIGYVLFDSKETEVNRRYFNLNYSTNIQKLIKKHLGSEEYDQLFSAKTARLKKNKIVYKYYWEDLIRQNKMGPLQWKLYADGNYYGEPNEGDEYQLGRDWDMSNGIRRTYDYSKFIIEEQVKIYPGINCKSCNKICKHEFGENHTTECGKCQEVKDEITIEDYDFKSNPKASIQNITYQQALAFYNWKYQKPSYFNNSKRKIYDDLVPTEEEFNRVQKGEKIILKARKIDYPTPTFRYVIHVYPK
ncbi:hypothetical protein K6119_04000 [Paracrocinitomix mangrovi]|uniref:hypothetical protein n=1 Tax=Paracrocinitomix mangrovi TaxID=2862509 RepID=UPI001C8E9E43|nr:hypothetical protein [Paracrocinitomix mangrovi]UKN02675.1 hypothetical protein K6119_04000 [Paracrocinitomix mangrovi]